MWVYLLLNILWHAEIKWCKIKILSQLNILFVLFLIKAEVSFTEIVFWSDELQDEGCISNPLRSYPHQFNTILLIQLPTVPYCRKSMFSTACYNVRIYFFWKMNKYELVQFQGTFLSCWLIVAFLQLILQKTGFLKVFFY